MKVFKNEKGGRCMKKKKMKFNEEVEALSIYLSDCY